MSNVVTKDKVQVKKVIYYNAQSNWGVFAIENDNPSNIFPDKEITVAGNFEGVYDDCLVSFTAEVTNHPRYGNQLQIQSCKVVEDTSSKETIVNFLTKSTIAGIKTQLALKIYNQFKEDSIRVVLHETEKLKEIKGIGDKTYQIVKESVAEYHQMEDLLDYCTQIGLTKYSLITQLFHEFGTDAVEILKENPYKLCDLSESFTFSQADDIALKAGGAIDSDNRLIYGLKYTLYRESVLRGSTGCLDPDLKQAFLRTLSLSDTQYYRYAVTKLEETGAIIRDDNSIFPTIFYNAEKNIGRMLVELSHNTAMQSLSNDVIKKEISAFPFTLNEKQIEAVYSCLQNRVSVITGLAGVGKTTITKAVINILAQHRNNIFLLAPTAKAAKVLSKKTKRPAYTIHKFLKIVDSSLKPAEPVTIPQFSAVIVDEVSMVDVRLFEKLLDVLQRDTRLILVGDPRQLPSVQAGNLLEDIIESGKINVCFLTDITRQAEDSNIIKYSNGVNNGEYIPPKFKSEDLIYLDAPNQYRDKMMSSLIKSFISSVKEHGLNNVQVICAYKQGELGVNNVNKALKEAYQFYKHGISVNLNDKTAPFPFHVDDKVRHTINNYELEVFNGETGVVTKIMEAEDPCNNEGKDVLVVSYDDRDVVYDKSTVSQLQLSYASTIHASQGSEYKIVYVVLDNEISSNLLMRNLVYTAITRASQKCYILSIDNSVNVAIFNNNFKPRLTKLKEFIIESGDK